MQNLAPKGEKGDYMRKYDSFYTETKKMLSLFFF